MQVTEGHPWTLFSGFRAVAHTLETSRKTVETSTEPGDRKLGCICLKNKSQLSGLVREDLICSVAFVYGRRVTLCKNTYSKYNMNGHTNRTCLTRVQQQVLKRNQAVLSVCTATRAACLKTTTTWHWRGGRSKARLRLRRRRLLGPARVTWTAVLFSTTPILKTIRRTWRIATSQIHIRCDTAVTTAVRLTESGVRLFAL